MNKTTMKSFWSVMLLVFICSNLSAQNPVNKSKVRNHSILDGMFLNSKTTAHNPLVLQGLGTTSPYYKVKKGESVKYQLDSLVFIVGQNGIDTDMSKGKIECKYDSLGRMILFVSESFDSTNVLVSDYKYVYSYGSTYSIRDEYNTYSGPVRFSQRTKTIYDDNNRIQTIKEGSDTVNFENNASRSEYIYENNLLSTINSYYSYSVTPHNMVRYYYDSLNRDTAEVTFQHYASIDSLTQYEKVTYTYDVKNDMINSETFYYSNGYWSPDSKSSLIYNNSHDCISYTANNFMDSVYVGMGRYISTYNKSVEMSDIYSGDTFNDFYFTFKSQLENIDLYILNTNDSLNLYMGGYTFYYSESNKSTGIDNTSTITNELVRYNALSKTITLQNTEIGNSNQLQLYRLSGNLMLNRPISTLQSVSVDKLGNGLYVYRLITAGKTMVGKILLQ
jgi:hypothetical protein